MALFGWLRRLFTHTAATPPAMSSDYQPAGLGRADPPDLLVAEEAPIDLPPKTSQPARRVAEGSEAHIEQPVAAIVATSAPTSPALRKPLEIAAESTSHAAVRASDGFGVSLGEDVYGLTFAIEYTAADGTFSRRRIMLRSVSAKDDGATYLRALCFERSAPRSFRLDRVNAIIDADGVVHDDPAAFLRDELRLTLPSAPELAGLGAQPAYGGAEKPSIAQRRVARDGLRILCALGRADGLLHSSETDAVIDYIEAVCRAEGVPCHEHDRDALNAYIRRQRPGLDVLEGCLRRLETGSPAARALLLDHAERLIRADGMEHDAEIRLLADIRKAG